MLKKIGKAVAFPHIAVLFILLPVSVVFLVYAVVFTGAESVPAVVSYVLSAYTLTVWCFKIPFFIRFFKAFKNENRYARRWQDDTHLRVNVSLYGTLLFNTAYAVLHIGLGFRHRSYWYTSLACYYITLAVMRFFLVRHTRRHKAGELMEEELRKYRRCGIVFLVTNLMLSLMIFFMIYWNRTFVHHEITTIAMAAYTFTTLAVAIVNMVKYRKYSSPVYSASKAISLASACVSMLTLESTMLTTFGKDTMTLTGRRIFLGSSGAAVSVVVITLAVYMIAAGTKKLKEYKD